MFKYKKNQWVVGQLQAVYNIHAITISEKAEKQKKNFFNDFPNLMETETHRSKQFNQFQEQEHTENNT